MKDYALFRKNFPSLLFEEGFSFARHTTLGAGGTAALAAEPAGIWDAAAFLRFLNEEEIPHCILGAGANVLASDGFFDGVVVRLCRMDTLCCGGDTLFAEAGVLGGRLLAFAEEHCLTGFEPFAGIPMTVGGGCAMNAGVAERHFSDLVEEAVAFDGEQLVTLTRKGCRFSVKDSAFLHGLTVLGVRFRAERAERNEIKARTAQFTERRRRLPKGRSMGCTFVNPEGGYAGELIEACGLKGRRCGGAHVSREHANFIINEGENAADVARLIDEIKEEVYQKTGILLREEIRRIP